MNIYKHDICEAKEDKKISNNLQQHQFGSHVRLAMKIVRQLKTREKLKTKQKQNDQINITTSLDNNGLRSGQGSSSENSRTIHI